VVREYSGAVIQNIFFRRSGFYPRRGLPIIAIGETYGHVGDRVVGKSGDEWGEGG
jgi:hypothetical protein